MILTAIVLALLHVPSAAGASSVETVTPGANSSVTTGADTQGEYHASEVPAWAQGEPIHFYPGPPAGQQVQVEPLRSEASEHTSAAASAAVATSMPQAAPSPAFDPLRYEGGSVQHRPHVFLIFWGNAWNEHAAERTRLVELFRWINNSKWTGILSQYFDRSGYVGREVDLSSYTDPTPALETSEASAKQEIKSSIQSQGWPPSSLESTYIVFPAPGTPESPSFKAGCGFHGYFREIGAEWAYINYADARLPGCKIEGSISKGMTYTASHEFAEGVVDPIPYNANHDLPNGWNRPGEAIVGPGEEHGGEEIADLCVNKGVVEIAPETVVAKLFDDYLNSATGAYCVAQDETPIPYRVTVGTTSPSQQQATVTGSVVPGGYPGAYRFKVESTTPGVSYSQTLPASFQSVGNGFGAVSVKATFTGLVPVTHYKVTLESFDQLTESEFRGTTTILTPEGSFETLPPPPAATTATPGGVQLNGATVSGTVNPQGAATTYYFEYGTSPSFGSKSATGSAGSGKEPVPVSQALTGLEYGREYSVRLAAVNAGGTSYGATQHFSTGGWRPEANSGMSPEPGLTAVACPATTRCFAVGGEKVKGASKPTIETWNGSAWSDVALSLPSGFTRGHLRSISCGGSSSCIAVGTVETAQSEAGVVPVVESWNGSAWSTSVLAQQTKGRSLSPFAVSCTSPTACIAVGNNTFFQISPYVRETSPYIARWNGSTWTMLTPPAAQTGYPWLVFTGLSCTSTSSCMATARESGGEAPERSSVWSWNGSTWTPRSIPTPEGDKETVVETISCASSTFCIAAGLTYAPNIFTGGRTLPYVTTWNGSAWSARTLPLPPGAWYVDLEGVACPTTTSCEAVGNWRPEHFYEEHPFASGYSAGAWSEQAIPGPSGSVVARARGVTCLAAENCKAVGDGAANLEGTGHPLALTDEWRKPKP